ncbi:MAG TPA: GNAT family N-acetyltransferase [Kofleriaceae bacterium]|nr:GNAT family N-acetyltransferase [Kofleriaceae bacterium]
MQVRSLGYRTDLLFARFDGQVLDRGDYLVVRTPSNPGFYWGNYLLFDAPPTGADLLRWPALFAAEHPSARHMCLGWDHDDSGATEAFAARDYLVMDDAVLVTDQRPPARSTSGFEVRTLGSASDWTAMWRLNIACDPQEGSTVGYDSFKEALRLRYRAMVEADHGRWLGAFVGAELIGALGVFVERSDGTPADGTLARLQCVETHPEHRGRGVCAALTAAAIATGLGELGATRVVVVADHASQAERIYLRAGFRAVSRQRGVYLATRVR